MSTQTEPQDLQKVTSKKGTPTWEMAYFYPNQGDWTEEKYLALDTNRLIEFRNGCLEFLPMPTFFHQRLVAYFYHQLLALVLKEKLGEVFFAPLRIRTVEGAIREPDVVFVTPDRIQNPHEPPNGADLVAEVVSPGTEARQRDLEEKRREYALAGIREYWIIDPETQTVTVLALDGETFHQHGEFTSGQTADSPLLEGFAIDVTALFSAGQPREQNS